MEWAEHLLGKAIKRSMHWLDIIILGTTAAGAVWGAFIGLIWQVSRILSVIFALYSTLALNDLATPIVQRYLMPQTTAPIPQLTAYALVFLAVWLGFFLLTVLLHRTVEKLELQWLNRMMGALFGAAKVVLVAGILLLTLSLFSGPREMMRDSLLAEPLISSMKLATSLLPPQYRDVFEEPKEGKAVGDRLI